MKRRRRSRLRLAIATGLCVCACNAILEIEDGHPKERGTDGGPDGNYGADADLLPTIECDAALPPSELFATSDAGPAVIASDGVHVYWAGTYKVERKPTALDAGVEWLFSIAFPISALALTDAHVVLVAGSTPRSYPKVRGSVSDTSTAQASALAAFGANVFFPSVANVYRATPPTTGQVDLGPIAEGTAIAAAKGTVVVVAKEDVPSEADGAGTTERSTIWSVGDAPNAPDLRVYSARGSVPERVATDGRQIFFTDSARQVVAKLPIVEGATPMDLARGQIGLGDIIVMANDVFFATAEGIRSVPLDGGCVRSITSTSTRAFTVDGRNVYWPSGNKIMRAAP